MDRTWAKPQGCVQKKKGSVRAQLDRAHLAAPLSPPCWPTFSRSLFARSSSWALPALGAADAPCTADGVAPTQTCRSVVATLIKKCKRMWSRPRFRRLRTSGDT